VQLQDTLAAEGSAPPRARLVRGTNIDRYVVLEELGEGAMGVVYKAFDPYLERKVAVKLVHPMGAADQTEARARLLREAQALAKLSHPNVVAVHDVGFAGEGVFLAMDLVVGRTLAAWLTELRPSRREILRVFVDAGRGLAAAHAAGLVHRDFKPDNVILRDDGRVHVLDFGLARAGDSTVDAKESVDPLSETAAPTSSGALAARLTEDGALVGTPAYMAPEQFRAGSIDARADQFAFTVSLWEALTGEPPFEGDTVMDLYAAIVARKMRHPHTRLPSRLRDPLLRAMAFKPDDRFASMDELLASIDDSSAPRGRWIVVGVVILAALAVGALAHSTKAAPVCDGAERELVGTWDESKREAVHQAFLATKEPYAEVAWQGVDRSLGDYEKKWVAAHRDACEATSVRHEQSADLLDRRMACLSRRRGALSALVDVLGHADAKVVEKAVDATSELPPIADCADVSTLLARVKSPADAATRASAARIEKQLDTVEALFNAGKFRDALPAAKQASDDAATLSYLPTRTEARYWYGRMQARSGDYAAADASLFDALSDAIESGDDTAQVRIWTQLVYTAARQARFAESEKYGALGMSALHHSGSTYELKNIANNLGLTYKYAGKYADAEHWFTVAEQAWGNAPGVGTPLYNLGTTLESEGKLPEAEERYRRCLEIRTASFGADHPSLAYPLSGLGNVKTRRGSFDEAESDLLRAKQLLERQFGPRHSNVGDIVDSLGELERARGNPANARARYTEALAIVEAALGSNHPNLAHSLGGIARSYLDEKRPADALPFAERAYAITTASPVEPSVSAEIELALARALVATGGDAKRAHTLAEAAAAKYAVLGPGWASPAAEVKTWLERNQLTR